MPGRHPKLGELEWSAAEPDEERTLKNAFPVERQLTEEDEEEEEDFAAKFPGISAGAIKVLQADPTLTPRTAEKTAVKQAEVVKLVDKFKRDLEDEEDRDPNPVRPDGTLKPPRPFVDLPPFNICIAVTIIINAVVIGLDTDMAAGNDGLLPQGLVTTLQILCLLVFVVELVLRIVFAGPKMFFFQRTRRLWNCMDFVIVMSAVVGTVVLMGNPQGDNLRLIMTMQVLKILRLLRLIRFIPIFHELWLVSNGLLNSLRVLMWMSGILFLFIYMFAILCTLRIGQNDDLYDAYFKESGGWDHEIYFGTVARSAFTMVQILTLDDWANDVARHVLSQQWEMGVLFLIFILIASFGCAAIVIGVIVENTLLTAANDEQYTKHKQERDRQLVFGQLREIFEDADTDGSGTLDLPEVEKATRKPEVYNKLKMIDFPVEDPKEIFEVLDFDKSGELTIEEFITGCIRMKGQAKSKDLLVAQVALDGMKRHYKHFESQAEKFHTKLKDLEKTVRSLVFQGELVFLNSQEYRLRNPQFKGSDMPQASEADLKKAPWEGGPGNLKNKPAIDLAATEIFSQGSFGVPSGSRSGSGSKSRSNKGDPFLKLEDTDLPIADEEASEKSWDSNTRRRGRAAYRSSQALEMALPGQTEEGVPALQDG